MISDNRPWCVVQSPGSYHKLHGRIVGPDVGGKLRVEFATGDQASFSARELEVFPVQGTGGTPIEGCMVEICTDRGETIGVKRGQLGRVEKVDIPGLRALVRTRGTTGHVTAWASFDELHVIGGGER